MTYEVNEVHFQMIAGISQVKTYSYLLGKTNESKDKYSANIEINLTYFDIEYYEKYSQFSFPVEINLESNQERQMVNLKNLTLEVIENQGINVNFSLEVELGEIVEVQEEVKDELKEEYQDVLEQKLAERFEADPIESTYNDEENQEEATTDSELTEASDELSKVDEGEAEVIATETPTIIIPNDIEAKIIKKETVDAFSLARTLKTGYTKHLVISLDNEAEFDKIALKYAIPVEQIYRAKKSGNRLIVHVKE